MTRMARQIARLTALLIGLTITPAALALATVELTPTSVIQDDTTLQLDNIVGDNRYVLDKNKRSVNLPAGEYTARVLVKGLPVGEQFTVKLAEGPNQLNVDSSGKVTSMPMPKPVGSGPGTAPSQFSIYAGAGSVRRDGVSFNVDPVTEQRLVQTPGTIDTFALDMTWRLPSGIQLNAGGMGGDRSNNAEVPIGQKAGVTFLEPQNAITGFSSNGGAGMNAKTDFYDLYLGATLPSRVFKDEEDSWFRGYIPLRVRYTETKDRGTFNVLANPSIWSTTDIKVKEWDVSGGYEVRGEHRFPNGLVGSAGIGAEAIYYHASLNATQAFVCPICSAAIQMVDVSTSDSRNRLTFGALVSGGLSYPVSDKASISFRLMYEEIWNAPTVLNKGSPNDAGTHLGTGNLGIASAQLGVAVKF